MKEMLDDLRRWHGEITLKELILNDRNQDLWRVIDGCVIWQKDMMVMSQNHYMNKR